MDLEQACCELLTYLCQQVQEAISSHTCDVELQGIQKDPFHSQQVVGSEAVSSNCYELSYRGMLDLQREVTPAQTYG